MFRLLLCNALFALTATRHLPAGELYYTGFEGFTVGDDTIAGTDGWLGSSAHAGLQLSGVDAEADHLVKGIGNAAWIGGNAGALPSNSSSSYRTVRVWYPVNADPISLDQEVMRFRINCGIKDSSGFPALRDNFEYAFYNKNNSLIGFIQFDNTTLDTTGRNPAQIIRRSVWRNSPLPAAWTAEDTGLTFTYDVLMELVVRINFRTNLWSASLDGLDIFTDQVFYAGTLARNLGSVAVQMQIYNPRFSTASPIPGNNYMLFDDCAVRLDPPPLTVIWDFTRNPASGAVQMSWLAEAAYHYQIQYSDDLTQPWKNDLPGSFTTAVRTGQSAVFTDTSATGKARRFYRVVPSNP